jgi:hypothetical protein
MHNKLVGATGILVTLVFITGFLGLFIINPQTLEEINNVSLTFYNLKGMHGRIWAVSVIYSAVGTLNIIFGLLLIMLTKKWGVTVVGEILLLVFGVVWLSYGLFPYDAETDFGINLMLLRIAITMLTGSIGLLLLAAEFKVIISNKYMKWYTQLSGLVILLLALISIFVYDTTWIRTNASLVLYFIWFGVFGLAQLKIYPPGFPK